MTADINKREIRSIISYLLKHPEDRLCKDESSKLWHETFHKLDDSQKARFEQIKSDVIEDTLDEKIDYILALCDIDQGAALFGEVKETISRHYHFEHPWHYVISTLFTFQAKIALILPGVFYLFFGGLIGSGKTNILDLLRMLTNGDMFENVSIPAFARSMQNGKPVFIDEVDVRRSKEYDDIRNSLLRQGYRRNAAPYKRWNISTNDFDIIPVYGAKAVTYRSRLDTAFKDRGFTIPTVKKKGKDGYDLVLANLWPNVYNLPSRLDNWAKTVITNYSPDELKAWAYSEEFKKEVENTVVELGANRESELITIALLVARIIGIDVVEELKKAAKLRSDSSESLDDLQELSEIIIELATNDQTKILEELPDIRLKQTDIKLMLNQRKQSRGEKLLSDRGFAKLRNDLGINDSMLRRPGNAVFWCLPMPFYRDMTNLANMANIFERPGQQAGEVSQVNQVSQGGNSISNESNPQYNIEEPDFDRESESEVPDEESDQDMIAELEEIKNKGVKK